MARARFADILRLLVEHDVEFIVVGMAAGVLQGVPLTTMDIDILHRRTAENVARLLVVLAKIGAIFRGDPRKLTPSDSHLLGPGHQLLTSNFGDLDCLGTVGDGKSYEDMIHAIAVVSLSDGAAIKVLSLSSLIELKRQAGRPKDLAAIPHLESTLDEVRRRNGDS